MENKREFASAIRASLHRDGSGLACDLQAFADRIMKEEPADDETEETPKTVGIAEVQPMLIKTKTRLRSKARQ